VVPTTLTLHSSMGKRTVRWNDSASKDVVISDFE
jgi:hypothetical protein